MALIFDGFRKDFASADCGGWENKKSKKKKIRKIRHGIEDMDGIGGMITVGIDSYTGA